jgi:hypothetical protein
MWCARRRAARPPPSVRRRPAADLRGACRGRRQAAWAPGVFRIAHDKIGGCEVSQRPRLPLSRIATPQPIPAGTPTPSQQSRLRARFTTGAHPSGGRRVEAVRRRRQRIVQGALGCGHGNASVHDKGGEALISPCTRLLGSALRRVFLVRIHGKGKAADLINSAARVIVARGGPGAAAGASSSHAVGAGPHWVRPSGFEGKRSGRPRGSSAATGRGARRGAQHRQCTHAIVPGRENFRAGSCQAPQAGASAAARTHTAPQYAFTGGRVRLRPAPPRTRQTLKGGVRSGACQWRGARPGGFRRFVGAPVHPS